MARNSKIRFAWDIDKPNVLLAIRDKGAITYPDLLEAINARDVDFQGRVFAMAFVVDRDRLLPAGWNDVDEPEGDVWELHEVMDGEMCPVCGKLSQHTYCPTCGKYVYPEMDF